MSKQKFQVGDVVKPVKGRVDKSYMYLFPNGKATIAEVEKTITYGIYYCINSPLGDRFRAQDLELVESVKKVVYSTELRVIAEELDFLDVTCIQKKLRTIARELKAKGM